MRLAGAVTIVAAIAYLFTPLTAAGPEGHPLAFGINLRYLTPGLALGLALLPLEPRIVPARLRLPLIVGGLIALFFTSHYSDANVAWKGHVRLDPLGRADRDRADRRPGRPRPARSAQSDARGTRGRGAGCSRSRAVGWAKQDDYFAHRYSRAEDFRFQLDDAVRWAKPTSNLRIGVAGTSGAYNQYGFYGDDVSNYVQYIGRHLPEADFRAIENCPDFRRAVNDGDYDYLITTPELDLNTPSNASASPERGWVKNDPAVEELVHAGRVSVFRITGELSPAGCGAGEPARCRGSTRRIGHDQAVSGVGDYILGVLGLVAVVLSMAIAGRTTRRAVLPSWTGPPALLADSVLAIGILIVVAELLGLFGVLDGVLLVAACLIVGGGALRLEPMLIAPALGSPTGGSPRSPICCRRRP